MRRTSPTQPSSRRKTGSRAAISSGRPAHAATSRRSSLEDPDRGARRRAGRAWSRRRRSGTGLRDRARRRGARRCRGRCRVARRARPRGPTRRTAESASGRCCGHGHIGGREHDRHRRVRIGSAGGRRHGRPRPMFRRFSGRPATPALGRWNELGDWARAHVSMVAPRASARGPRRSRRGRRTIVPMGPVRPVAIR